MTPHWSVYYAVLFNLLICRPRNFFCLRCRRTPRDFARDALLYPIPDVDVRKWQPYVPGDLLYDIQLHTISAPNLTLVSDITPGVYMWGLYLPDAYAKNVLKCDNRFSLRFANVPEQPSSWWADALGTGGVNALGQVQVL